MKLAAITAGIVLAALAAGAHAQGAAEAKRLLQGAADPGDFADVSAGGKIALKHKPSGLVCPFSADPRGNTLHASPEGVICEANEPAQFNSIQAFRIPQASESDVQGAMARAMGAFTGAQPVTGFTDAKADRAGAPPHVSRRFSAATRDGQSLFVRIAYSQVGEWFVLQRVISLPSDAQAADADGERRLLAAIGQVMDRQAPRR